MVKNKKKPFYVKDWDHLIVLLEDIYAEDYGLTPTEALECIRKHFKKYQEPRSYWKRNRILQYITQRYIDTKDAIFKLSKENKKYKNFKEYKKRFKILCGKKNKRIDTVRRTVKSELYAKHFKRANFQRIEYLKTLSKNDQINHKFRIKNFKVLEGDHLKREIIQLNKLICDYREDKYFDVKLLYVEADRIKGREMSKAYYKNKQFQINLLR